jgi:hypothetical protein
VARFDPDKFPSSGPIMLGADTEKPFDYGVERNKTNRKAEEKAALQGVIDVSWAMGGPNGYNNGIGVSARGDVMILTENYKDLAEMLGGRTKFVEGTLDNIERRGKEDLKDPNRYRAAEYPGRPGSANFIWRWNSKGQVLAADAVPALPLNSTFGIRMAPDGRYIVGVGGHQNIMTKSELAAVAKALGHRVPPHYRKFIMAHTEDLQQVGSNFYRKPDELIQHNQLARESATDVFPIGPDDSPFRRTTS